jgi:hypothetical protein
VRTVLDAPEYAVAAKAADAIAQLPAPEQTLEELIARISWPGFTGRSVGGLWWDEQS